MASYSRLKSGEWGIRVEGAKPAPGSKVTVKKRTGEAKTETVGTVLWSGNGVHLCTISSSSSPARGRSSSSGVCRGCRGPIVNARHHRAMEGYCGSCAFDEFDC